MASRGVTTSMASQYQTEPNKPLAKWPGEGACAQRAVAFQKPNPATARKKNPVT